MKQCSGVNLQLDQHKHWVLAKVTPSVQDAPVTEDYIRNELSEKFEDFILVDKALADLLKCCEENKDEQCIDLARLKPYKILLQLSEDKRQVMARGYARLGDEDLSEKVLKRQFEEQRFNIEYKIDDGVFTKLEEACEEGKSQFEIVYGRKLYASVHLDVDTTGKQLVAKVTPRSTTEEVDEKILLARIGGYENFALSKFDSVLGACIANEAVLMATVAYKKEPFVELFISEDGLSIEAKISQAKGSEKISMPWFEAQFRDPELEDFYLTQAGAAEAVAFCEKNEADHTIQVGQLSHMQVTLNVDEEGAFLVAHLQPKKSITEFTLEWLEKQFELPLFREYRLLEGVGAELLEQCSLNAEESEFTIAQKYEAKVEFEHSDDGSLLLAIVTPCSSLQRMTEESLLQIFQEGEHQDYRLIEDRKDELLLECMQNRAERSVALAQKREARIELIGSEDGKRVVANMVPSRGDGPIDAHVISTFLDESEFSDFYRLTENIGLLLTQCELNNEPFEIDVAVQSNASILIKVSEDKLTAYAEYDVAYGGERLDKACVIKTIATAKISYGVIKEQLVQLIKSLDTMAGPCTWVIARGVAPVRGKDSQFVNMSLPVKIEDTEDDGVQSVDMRNMGEIHGVKKGQAIMRLDPPEEGRSGKNVLGELIPAEPGEALEYVEELLGVEVDPENSTILIATMDGMPVPVERGITVQQTYSVDHVNVNTGDIRFQGCVYVKEDVDAGACIECSGDIIVGGMVGNAHLKAGGDIKVEGGVIGEYPELDPNMEFVEESLSWRCTLDALGNISLNYVSNARVRSGKSIVIKEYSSHSIITSGEDITFGKGRISSIIGGRVKAKATIQVSNLGNDAGVKTLVEVGELRRKDPLLKLMKNDLADKRALTAKYLHVLDISKDKTTEDAQEKRARVETALAKIIEDMALIEEQIEQIEEKSSLEVKPKIVVAKKIYSAVSVVVCGQRENYVRVVPGGELLLKDDKFFHKMK